MNGLEIKKCCLVVVDVQGRLAELMHDKNTLFKNIEILIRSAKILDIPIIWCQQTPTALGATIPRIAGLFEGVEPIDKSTFSCFAHQPFTDKLKSLDRSQVLLCGIEAHICIYQTAADLLREGYSVDVIADAVSSRIKKNKKVGLKRIEKIGANVSSTEMALFELLKSAEHPQFKQIVKLVK